MYRRFAHQLADDCGWASPDAMLREHGMTARQFLERKVWYEMETRGRAREDLHWARLLHLMFNLNVAKKDQKALKEFFLTFEERAAAEETTDDEKQRQLAINTQTVQMLKFMAAGYQAEDDGSMTTADGTVGMQRGVRKT